MSTSLEESLKAEDITKNYKKLNADHIASALTAPELIPYLLSVIPKFNDDQLRMVFPLMTLDQVKTTIPKLQLQQTGVAVQAMTPPQIRQTISALTTDDRNILKQNISLLSLSSNREELQSFITFVDPLAMAIAIKMPDLTNRIIECASIMTHDQLRVVIPLLEEKEIRDIFKVLEDETQLDIALSMIIDKREILVQQAEQDLEGIIKMKDDLRSRHFVASNQMQELIRQVEHVEQNQIEYQTIVRLLKNAKTQIEALKMSIRETLSTFKLPLKIIPSNQRAELLDQFTRLFQEISELGKQVHILFTSLTTITDQMNLKLHQYKLQQQSEEDMSASDNSEVVLYEAIKQLGNPQTIGNWYSMTWSDILQCGFRCAEDFTRKDIHSLEQLQYYINNHKK